VCGGKIAEMIRRPTVNRTLKHMPWRSFFFVVSVVLLEM
jgi:hypothetical protein